MHISRYIHILFASVYHPPMPMLKFPKSLAAHSSTWHGFQVPSVTTVVETSPCLWSKIRASKKKWVILTPVWALQKHRQRYLEGCPNIFGNGMYCNSIDWRDSSPVQPCVLNLQSVIWKHGHRGTEMGYLNRLLCCSREERSMGTIEQCRFLDSFGSYAFHLFQTTFCQMPGAKSQINPQI